MYVWCMFPTGMWNSREDDQDQSVDTSHSHEHDDMVIPSSGVGLTEDNNRKKDAVSDR